MPHQYDCLVHCAAEVPATVPDPDLLLRSNVEATQRIFEHATNAGARRIVYMSSMAVYGKITEPAVDESTVPASPGAYGRSKAAGEVLLHDWGGAASDRAGIAIRLPGVVGAGGRNNFLCDTLARILAGGLAIAKYPDARFNNVVHVADLAEFVVEVLPRLRGIEPLTLGAIEPLTIREVLERLFSRAGKPPRIEWTNGDGGSFLISFKRALALGYVPATVADSVDRFVADVLAAGVR